MENETKSVISKKVKSELLPICGCPDSIPDGKADSSLYNDKMLLEQYEEAAFICDAESLQILYMNKNCRRLLGIETEEVLDERYGRAYLKKMGFVADENPAYGLQDSRYYVWEDYNEVLGRKLVHRERLVAWDGQAAMLDILIDISEEDKAEKLIATKIRVENMLLNCIGAISSEIDFTNAQTTLLPMLEAIGEFYHADRAYIVHLEDDALNMNTVCEWCREGVIDDTKLPPRQSMNFSGIRKQVFESRRPYLLQDVEFLKDSNPQEYERQKMRGIHSLYMVPFLNEETVGGYVCVDNPVVDIGNLPLLNTMTLFLSNQLAHYQMRSEQEKQIYHDRLTGLPNRSSYVRYLKQQGGVTEQSLGAATININRLGQINHDFGQGSGDAVVKNVARALMNTFSGYSIFRLDGDEFIIVCLGISQEEMARMTQDVGRYLDKNVLHGVTIGYTWGDVGEKDISEMMDLAYQQMIANKKLYYIKNQTSSRYSDERDVEGVKEGLKNGNFVVFLQPKISIQTERIEGMEALIRYRLEDGRIVPPRKFIPYLEKQGLIRYVDYFVLQQVCKLLTDWKEKGYPLYPISLNFSRKTLREPEAVETLTAVVEEYGIPKDLILIEITESGGDMERDVFTDIGQCICDNGFGVSLDDFCSQYSCVSLLTLLPYKEIKFDRSMIEPLDKDEKIPIVCRSMMRICRRLGYRVTAEGVERESQLEILRGMDCDVVQGYYFSRPIPVPEFEERYLQEKNDCGRT